MDEKRSPIAVGLGGAALAAALLAVGGPGAAHVTAPEKKSAIVETASINADITSNQEGPWYAFCQEYATNEFDKGNDPAQPRGITGHQVPEEAEDGTAEITRPFKNKRGQKEVEKFNVRRHTVGELTSCVPDGERLRVAIAIVPDPNATQMKLDFDRDIVAIQRAAAAENYLYTRFWFPWRGGDWTAEKGDDAEAEVRRRQEPGILCFRRKGGDGTTDRLFVLLVGETPTSGANRIQLSHALYYGHTLTGTEKYPQRAAKNPSYTTQIELSGPHFSASFKPLRDVLMKIKEEHSADLAIRKSQADEMQFANIVSPDASGQEFIGEFRKFCFDQKNLCQLRTLALPSSEVQDQALALLDTLGYKQKFVAQLSEDESAFGESQLGPEAANAMPTGSADAKGDQPAREYGLKLRYPRDLSSARNLSDEQSMKIAQAGSSYLSLSAGALPTQLSVRQPTDRDSPAAFGEEQEPSEVARSLADSIAEMRAHNIRAVVISASNPLDRIYLLEYLHKQLPDVRAVTVDADRLELDRPHFIDLTGTIAVTAMPLLSGMSNNTGSGKASIDHISFQSSRQEGQFLAMETLLSGNFSLTDVGAKRPCLSFSVVGNDGFKLLQSVRLKGETLTFPCHVNQGSSERVDSIQGVPAAHLWIREHANAPRNFLTFAGVILFANVIHWWSLAAGWRKVEGFFSYAQQMTGKLETRRLYLLFVLNNQLLIVSLLITRISLAALASIKDSDVPNKLLRFLSYSLVMATVVATALSVWFFFQWKRSHKAEQVNEGSKAMAFNMGAAIAFLASSVAMIGFLPITSEGNGIFLERITHLEDGLSPVLPIAAILLGYFLWAFLQLRRLEWTASREIHLGFTQASSPLLSCCVGSLQSCLEELTPEAPWVLATCSIIAISVALSLRQSLNGLDGGGFFYWFQVWGTVMLLLTVALTCVHAWTIWRRLQKLLLLLEETPLSGTFKTLAGARKMQVKIWDLAKREKTFKFLQGTVDSLARLYGPKSPEALGAKAQLDQLVREDATRRQPLPGEIREFSSCLNIAMDPAIEALFADTPATPRRDELLVYLAYRMVALIRYAMLQIGTLICFVAYGFVLAIGSIMFYPFEGRKTVGELLVMAFALLLGWVATMMIQFQRNEVLSHLEGSVPGQANYGQLLLRLLTVGGLPLIAILGSQFPQLANFAFSFFRPLLEVLH